MSFHKCFLTNGKNQPEIILYTSHAYYHILENARVCFFSYFHSPFTPPHNHHLESTLFFHHNYACRFLFNLFNPRCFA